MVDDSVTKAATGLAFIIPAILVVRWLLTRRIGSPDQWMEERITELKQRYARGQIDEEDYQRRLRELTEED